MPKSLNVGTINPAELSLIFKDHLISGYATGTFINIAHNADGFTVTKGTDGETARTMTNDDSVTITLTLMQTSQSNDVLSGFHKEDRSTGRGYGQVEFKDNMGTTEGGGSDAFIMSYADVTYANDVQAREWRIYVPNYSGIVGSNTPQ